MSQYRPTREEFRKTLWRAALPPLLLLAALAASVSLLLFQLLRANAWAQHSEEVISRTEEIERLVVLMETGVRGYMLSGSNEFLEPYEMARSRLDPAFAELHQRITDSPVQTDRLTQLQSAADEWQRLEPQLVSSATSPPDTTSPADPSSHSDSTLSVLRSRKTIMENMRRLIREMVVHETVLHHQRYEKFQRASSLAVLGSIGLSMSLGIGLALLNRRTIIRLTSVYQHALEAEDTRASELAASNKQFLDLAEAIPQLVWISDGQGKAIYFNSPWSTLTGLTVEQLTELGFESALHSDDRHVASERWKESLQTGLPFEAEYRVKRQSDGTYRWFLCRAMPVRDKAGRNVRWFGTCTDIESQKQVEHERETVLTAERKARSDLLRTNIIKDQFLATLSHELRTPMTAILGWIQLLRDPVIREKSLDRAIDSIESNARTQARLIEDLLDMSRILSGKLTIKPGVVDLHQIVQAAIDAVRPAALAKNITITQQLPAAEEVKLAGDAARLQQVVSNLLSNAVKFTPEAGKISVAVDACDGRARVVVSDSGRGINPEFLPHVFEQFRQADGSTTRQHGGLGLGLAIVKHLVEIHGGAVSAGSAGDGQGANFTVDLPLSPPAISAPASPEQKSGGSEAVSLDGISVMLVEDDQGAAEVVRAILERAGAQVDCASSALAGLERLGQKRFNVLISDIGMPDMDGYALIRRLRQSEANQDYSTPAIALTAFANKDDRDEALGAGYQLHLAKPVAASDLWQAVASVVENSQAKKV